MSAALEEKDKEYGKLFWDSSLDKAKLEIQSEYWYFLFVKEGYDHAYMLSLSAKEFSRSEAVETAKTVRMMEEKNE